MAEQDQTNPNANIPNTGLAQQGPNAMATAEAGPGITPQPVPQPAGQTAPAQQVTPAQTVGQAGAPTTTQPLPGQLPQQSQTIPTATGPSAATPEAPQQTISQMRQQVQAQVVQPGQTEVKPMPNGAVHSTTDPQTGITMTSKPFINGTQAQNGSTMVTSAQQPSTGGGQPPVAPPAANYAAVEQPGVIEEQVIKRKGRGCNPISCRSLTFVGCVLPLLLIVSAILLIIFKPAPVWGTVKDFANADIADRVYAASPTRESETPVDLTAKLNAAPLNAEGKRVVELTEEEVAAIFAKSFGTDESDYIDIRNDGLTIYLNLDKTEDPLWFYMDFAAQENNLQLKEAGFGRGPLPEQIVGRVSETLSSSLDFLNVDKVNELMTEVLNRGDLDIQGAEVDDDLITLTVDYNPEFVPDEMIQDNEN